MSVVESRMADARGFIVVTPERRRIINEVRQQLRLPAKAAKAFNEDQPRDDHGRWASGGEGEDDRDATPDTRSLLSSNERESVERWVRGEHLEGGTYKPDEDKDFQAALVKLPGVEDPVHRGVAMPRTAAEQIKVGNAVNLAGSESWSMSSGFASDWAERHSDSSERAVVFSVMYSEQARDLGNLNPLQREAVMPKGSSFRVSAVFDRDEFRSVTLEEVSSSKVLKVDRLPIQRITFQGFPVSIENPAGTYRVWGKPTDANGGRTLVLFAYGYIRRSMAEDGDHVDCYIGPNEQAREVYVVRQLNPWTGEQDEDKCFLGFNSVQEARAAFLAHWDPVLGPKAFGGITAYPVEDFRQKVHETMKRPGAVKIAFGYLAEKAFNEDQPRDEQGRWTGDGTSAPNEHEGDQSLSPARLSDMSPDDAERERGRLREVHGRQREASRVAKERAARNLDQAKDVTLAEDRARRDELFGNRPIALKGDISNLAASEMRTAYDGLPQTVKNSLNAGGITLRTASGATIGGVADLYPGLAGAQPRGWPEGSTWKEVSGVFAPSALAAMVTEGARDSSGKYELSTRIAGVTRHEIGHAFDMSNALNTDGSWASNMPFMRAAYDKDFASVMRSETDRLEGYYTASDKDSSGWVRSNADPERVRAMSKYSYFLQPGNAGREEAFAETFAQLHGAGSSRADMVAAFPNLAKEITSYVKTGRVRR